MDKVINKVNEKILSLRAGLAVKKEVLFAKLRETENGDHLLEVLGVIIIAVVLLIFFRAQIVAIFQNAIDKTAANVNALWGD